MDEITTDYDDEGGIVEGYEDYNARNTETFGSDEVDEDWESNHEHMSNIKEAERLKSNPRRTATDDNSFLVKNHEKSQIFTQPSMFHRHDLNSIKQPLDGLNSSNFGNSFGDVWKPQSSELINFNRQNSLNYLIPSLTTSPLNINSSGVKTVEELEEEMRRQKTAHINMRGPRSFETRHKIFGPNFGQENNSSMHSSAVCANIDDFKNRLQNQDSRLSTYDKINSGLHHLHQNTRYPVQNFPQNVRYHRDDFQNSSFAPRDEYAGLMTEKEKMWLRNIQFIQLQNDDPYQHDYYYIMHEAYQRRRHQEELVTMKKSKLFYDKSRDEKEYKPPQLEKSLGKLQIVSVNAPRKIIDFNVTTSDYSLIFSNIQGESKKRRHLLLHIEKLYNMYIQLDDLQKSIACLNDSPTRDLYESKFEEMLSKIWINLIVPQESFIQILTIRKGKALCSRILEFLSEKELEHIVVTTIENLSLISKRDNPDNYLPNFWPTLERLISFCQAPRLLVFGMKIASQLKPLQCSSIPVLDCQLTFSLLLCILIRGEQIWQEIQFEASWQDLLSDVVAACVHICDRDSPEFVCRPLPSLFLASSHSLIYSHLCRCSKADASHLLKAANYLKTLLSPVVESVSL